MNIGYCIKIYTLSPTVFRLLYSYNEKPLHLIPYKVQGKSYSSNNRIREMGKGTKAL